MPLVRISIPQGKSEAELQAIADGVHRAMVETINIPEHDRFQVIHEHAPGRIICDPEYLGVPRGPGALVVQITLHRGRPDAKKQALYRAVAGNLQAAGVRPEDVLVVLTENGSADWSFGGGEAQMLRPGVTPHWGARE